MSGFVSRSQRPISRTWIIASMVVFLAVELVLGTALGRLFQGHPGHVLKMRIEVLVMLASYFMGGLAVGFVSRGRRVDEPIIAAFLSVVLTFCLTLFTPLRFFQFKLGRILVGGLVAVVFAVLGVDVGSRGAERVRKRPRTLH